MTQASAQRALAGWPISWRQLRPVRRLQRCLALGERKVMPSRPKTWCALHTRIAQRIQLSSEERRRRRSSTFTAL
jgi:hypothetical protein